MTTPTDVVPDESALDDPDPELRGLALAELADLADSDRRMRRCIYLTALAAARRLAEQQEYLTTHPD